MEKISRRKARECVLAALFELSYGNVLDDIILHGREDGENALDEYGEWLLRTYDKNASIVDGQIHTRLKGWTKDRLPRVSLAILRLAITEMLYSQEDMDSIAINEAVELSKTFGDEGDYQFINGVLGNISREKGTIKIDTIPSDEQAN